MTSIAIILVDFEHGRFGHTAALNDELAGKTVLQHTLDRACRIEGLDAVVLLHPEGQTIDEALLHSASGVKVLAQAMQTRPGDDWLKGVIDSGRKWSLTAWRGGVGGMTVYDELLPAYPLLYVVQQLKAESAVVMRGDWCCLDPALATRQLELHRTAPDAMKLTFSQAPPGLAPLVLQRSVLEDMADHSATVANLLCYNPKKPAVDPVGKDVNVQIPASVRDQYRRFIYDTPRAVDHLGLIADKLGDSFTSADAVAITDVSRAVELDEPWRALERLPQQFNIELTPKRSVTGPIVPQHHLTLPRDPMQAGVIDMLLEQLPASGDCSVLFGGLGDALLHEDWHDILERACQTQLLGVGIETDLLVDEQTIERLATLPLDVIAVRINADTAETYEALMGVDGHGQVMDNLQALFKARNENRHENKGFRGWVVPRLVKVNENLKDMETFFERWMTVAGWAVIDRALTGRGLIPDMSPVPMEVPRAPGQPVHLHRAKQRLTVLSDGTVCLCGQDWLGRLPLGNITDKTLSDQWRDAPLLADDPQSATLVCPACWDWLAAQKKLLASA